MEKWGIDVDTVKQHLDTVEDRVKIAVNGEDVSQELLKCEVCNRPTLGHRNMFDEDCDYDEELTDEQFQEVVDEIVKLKEFTDKINEIKGKIMIRKNEKSVECDQCDYKGKNERALNIHKTKKHKKADEKTGNKKGSKNPSIEMFQLMMQESDKTRRELLDRQERKEREDRAERQAERQLEREAHENFLRSLIEKSNQQMNDNRSWDTSKTKVPTWDKEEALSVYKNKLFIWDQNTKLPPALKVQEFVRSFKDIRPEEFKRLEYEIYNDNFDHNDTEALKKAVKLLEDWFGKSVLEESVDEWRSFISLKMKTGETVAEFLRRFEMAETKFKSLKCPLPDRYLAIQLLDGTNLTEQEKRCIITKTVTQDDDKILKTMKSAIKEMKSSLIESKQTNETFYGRDSRRDRFENKEKGNRYNRNSDSRNRFDKNRSRSMGKNRSRSSSRNRSYSRHESDEKRNRSRSYSETDDRKRYRYDSKGREYKSPPKHTFNCVKVLENVNIDLDKHVLETETVNMGIIDSACPKAVVGTNWLQIYKSSLSDKELKNLKSTPCCEKFKFGPSQIYTSKESVRIQFQLGNKTEHIDVNVVDCEVPLLISGEDLERWNVDLSFRNKTLTVEKSGEIVNLTKLPSGHYALNLQKPENHRDIESCFFGAQSGETLKNIKKVHRSLGHQLSLIHISEPTRLLSIS